MSQVGGPILLGLFGLGMGLHCANAAREEFRNDAADGLFGTYSRKTKPIRFWIVIALNGLASLFGFALLAAGLAGTLK